MTSGGKHVFWTAGLGVIGAVIGVPLGIALELPGLGPTGVGFVVGAAIGYVIGLPKDR